ncbi:MAG: hypothetical protein LBG92_08260 [Prevotellaceae bacterium]|jgi:hypothetical protein|nr:hypothetical protein [Prevotellaceae bacterium]
MRKLIFSAAIIAASVVSVVNVTAKDVDALSVNASTAVSAPATYSGQACDLIMAGHDVPGCYDVKFDIDDVTGDITGDLIADPYVHDFHLEGNLSDGTCTGYIIIPEGTFFYLGNLYDVVFGSNGCVTFTCYAWIPDLETYSKFVFSGCKQ